MRQNRDNYAFLLPPEKLGELGRDEKKLAFYSSYNMSTFFNLQGDI